MTKEERLKAAESYTYKIDKFTNIDTHAFSNRDVNDIVSDTANKAFLAGAEAEADGNWIELKTKDDLPKDNEDYWAADKDGNVSVKSGFSIVLFNTTHYQPIVKPNPPINHKR